jgi:hypothetical protein
MAKVERPVEDLARVGVEFVHVCVHAASWSSRVAARRKRGSTVAVRGQGSGLVDGSGVHACARILHPRTTAWPCRARGTGIPGPWHDTAAERQRCLRGG